MKLEPLCSIADADWLPMRLALWPDCPREQHLEEMASFLREPGRYAQFIARAQNGQGLGFAEASVRTDYVNGTESSPVGYLEGLFVKAEARGQGVAKLLIGTVSEWAAAHGCAELASDTQPENFVSQAMHQRLGFVETERAVFYSKPLKPQNAATCPPGGEKLMPIALDHMIVPSKDRVASARQLAQLLGVPWAEQAAIGPFSPVYVSESLTLDFDEWTESIPKQHYCFRVTDAEFDSILERIVSAGIPFRSTPNGPNDDQVNRAFGGRLFYWGEPDGHTWEVLTISYARATGSATNGAA